MVRGWAWPAGGGPLQEVAHPVAGRRLTGQVGVDVGLADLGQGGSVVGEPVQQADRGGDVDAGVAGVAAGPVGPCRGRPEPAQDLPGGVGVDQATVAVAADAGQGSGQESFGSGELFVPGRQDLVGDQDGPQVVRRRPDGGGRPAPGGCRSVAPEAIWVSRAAPALLRSQFSAVRGALVVVIAW